MSYTHEVLQTLFAYSTPKIVLIKSILVGVIGRLIQITIIAYVIGYAIVYKKGYQEFSVPESSVTTKVKGVIFTNFSDDAFNENITHPEWYRRIWDVADYVVPPSENGAVFIATNVIVTANQSRGTCPENPDVIGAICNTVNNTCVARVALPAGNGVMTGNCINASVKSEVHTCEVEAWCPVEDSIFPLKNKTALLEESKEFTVLIKNFVDFPKFPNSHRRNIKDDAKKSYLKNCIYDPDKNPECPIFRLGDIVKWSGEANYNDVAYQGAVINIKLKWDCNFDFDKKYCFPTYEFTRLDDPHAKVAPGWNFRYADYFDDGKRTLHKMYGIRLTVTVVGQAGKFGIVPLLTNLGAGLALLAVQVVICDIIVLYLVKRRHYFKSKKYEEVATESEDSNTEPEICVQKSDQILRNAAGQRYERLED